MDDSNNVKTGTTTLGLICSDGVVFASDKRATMWHFIADKNIQKIYNITDYIAITTAGSVGDAQALVRYMQSEIKLYETREQRKMTIQGATTLMSNILFGYKMFPFYLLFLFTLKFLILFLCFNFEY